MNGQNTDQPTACSVEDRLREIGQQTVPVDLDASMPTFATLIAKVNDMDEDARAAAEMAVEAAEFGADAYALGQAMFAAGDFDRAEQWLRRAVRYGFPAAQACLDDLEALRAVLADLDEATEAAPSSDDLWSPASLRWDLPHHCRASAVEEDLTAKAEADAIIRDAKRKAMAILSDARRRAHSVRRSHIDAFSLDRLRLPAPFSTRLVLSSAEHLWRMPVATPQAFYYVACQSSASWVSSAVGHPYDDPQQTVVHDLDPLLHEMLSKIRICYESGWGQAWRHESMRLGTRVRTCDAFESDLVILLGNSTPIAVEVKNWRFNGHPCTNEWDLWTPPAAVAALSELPGELVAQTPDLVFPRSA